MNALAHSERCFVFLLGTEAKDDRSPPFKRAEDLAWLLDLLAWLLGDAIFLG